jgi:hypothetical protein
MTMLEAASITQHEAVDRVRRRTGQRHQKIEAITTGQLVLADEPLRIASRIERLSRYYPWEMRGSAPRIWLRAVGRSRTTVRPVASAL